MEVFLVFVDVVVLVLIRLKRSCDGREMVRRAAQLKMEDCC